MLLLGRIVRQLRADMGAAQVDNLLSLILSLLNHQGNVMKAGMGAAQVDNLLSLILSLLNHQGNVMKAGMGAAQVDNMMRTSILLLSLILKLTLIINMAGQPGRAQVWGRACITRGVLEFVLYWLSEAERVFKDQVWGRAYITRRRGHRHG